MSISTRPISEFLIVPYLQSDDLTAQLELSRNSISRSSITDATIGGLPVIKNLRRTTTAVRDLFTFDLQKYGIAVGFEKSLRWKH
jgi:hypothetical protein